MECVWFDWFDNSCGLKLVTCQRALICVSSHHSIHLNALEAGGGEIAGSEHDI